MRRRDTLPFRLIRTAFPVLFLLASGSIENALAQGCGNWMTPQYSTYTNYSTDGTYMYTSVTLNGTTTGTCPYGCGSICYGTTHTPRAYNAIGNVGGWKTGSAQPWNYQLSVINNQQIAVTPGTEYTFSWGGEVICSVVGVFYLVNGSSNEFAQTPIQHTYTVNPLGSLPCWVAQFFDAVNPKWEEAPCGGRGRGQLWTRVHCDQRLFAAIRVARLRHGGRNGGLSKLV